MGDKAGIDKSIQAGLNVLREERSALERLEGTILSPEFSRAVKILDQCKGRVVVIGMGKSGLVGQKIAATLTSTGVSSLYIHAGDALHGDLGAITSDDTVLLISKSGETREVLQTLPFLDNQKNSLIGITNEIDSSLAKACDVALDMKTESEGCPLNLAPMTSSTATLAIGDALASALIVSRGFSQEGFARFHPGGKLGWLLTASVADMIDRDNNPLLPEAATLREAVMKLVESRVGGVNIVDGAGLLAGVITDGDLKRIMLEDGNGWMEKSVCELMVKNPVSIQLSATAAEAIDLMEKRATQISVLPVLDNEGKPVGILRLHDIIRTHL